MKHTNTTNQSFILSRNISTLAPSREISAPAVLLKEEQPPVLSESKSRMDNFYSCLDSVKYLVDQTVPFDRSPINERMQTNIEWDCNSLHSAGTKIEQIKTSMLNSVTGKYIFDIEDKLKDRIVRFKYHLKDYYERYPLQTDSNQHYMYRICNWVHEDSFLSMCIYHYIEIASNEGTESGETGHDKMLLLPITIKMGKYIVNMYYRDIRLMIIEDEKKHYKIRELKEKTLNEQPDLWSKINDDSFLSVLGASFVEIMMDLKMLEKKVIRKSDLKYSVLTIVDEKVKAQAQKDSYYPPISLPMVIKPREYTSDYKGKGVDGGYIANEMWYSKELFIDRVAYKHATVIRLADKILSMVNGIGSTPFKINTKLLSLLVPDKFNILLPDEHKYANVEKKTKFHENHIKKHASKVRLQRTILKIADTFSSLPEIYFPVRLDQRGRLYCEPQYFNYQSSELARALLLFVKPGIISKQAEDIDKVNYLKIMGANYYGLDKRSIGYKLDWVDRNVLSIINYEDSGIIQKAKDPILFLSFCIEYERYIDFSNNPDKHEFETHLPIQLDATCNGFQHIALLSNETDLYKELNLYVDNKTGQSEDFYTFLLHRLDKELNKIVLDDKLDDEEKKRYFRLLDFNWEREMVKKSIMTMPYNSSLYSRGNTIKDHLIHDEWDETNNTNWYFKEGDNTKRINDKDIATITALVKKIIEHDHKKIGRLSLYLKAVASICCTLKIPISWNTPSGLKISQNYLKTHSTPIQPFSRSKVKLNLRITLSEIDVKKQMTSLMPNLIHSLDATSLCLLYNELANYYKNVQFYCVHDCFATTADKVDSLKEMLASIYTSLYIDDQYLLEFDNGILNSIKQANCTISKDRTISYTVRKSDGSLTTKTFKLFDIDWVLNKKRLNKATVRKIDDQFILV